MKPKHFKEVNVVMGKDQPEYEPLPALSIDGGMQVITCWELSPEEIERVKETGEIWLNVYAFGRNFPPVFLTTDRKDLFTTTEEEKSRCCGRCDGINDKCVSDMVCDTHLEEGCEICYGKRI